MVTSRNPEGENIVQAASRVLRFPPRVVSRPFFPPSNPHLRMPQHWGLIREQCSYLSQSRRREDRASRLARVTLPNHVS